MPHTLVAQGLAYTSDEAPVGIKGLLRVLVLLLGIERFSKCYYMLYFSSLVSDMVQWFSCVTVV
jgi:hypothetical protein